MANDPQTPLKLIAQKFETDPLAHQFSIVLDDITANTVKMHMKLEQWMLNFYLRPHGGAIYTLADAAFSVLGNNDNNISVALENSITYHASPEPGSILEVTGQTIAKTRKIASYLFSVFDLGQPDQKMEPKLIATMKSTLYRTGKPISDD